MGKSAQPRVDWGNLQYVLAVVRCKSIAAAAQSLGVNRTTVLRRINRLEQSLDFQLFDRRGSQYLLAPGAEHLLRGAQEVEKTVDDLHRQILGKEIQLEGTIIVTTTDSILVSTLSPHIASFRKKHPHIRVDMVIANHQLSLSRRDADIAVRPGLEVPPHLSGKLLGPMHFGLYVTRKLRQRHGEDDFQGYPWLSVESPLLESPPGRWLVENIDDSKIVCRTNSFVALRSLAETSLGITVLPTALGRQSRKLQQIFPEHPQITNNLWVVTHPDLLRSSRVHAFIDHLARETKTTSSGLES